MWLFKTLVEKLRITVGNWCDPCKMKNYRGFPTVVESLARVYCLAWSPDAIDPAFGIGHHFFIEQLEFFQYALFVGLVAIHQKSPFNWTTLSRRIVRRKHMRKNRRPGSVSPRI